MASFVDRLWHRVLSSRLLTLNGYVAFNLPRTVTALGGSLLAGLVAAHLYVLFTEQGLPLYFVGYLAVLCIGCLIAAAAIAVGVKPAVPQLGWYLGSTLCTIVLVVYLISRIQSIPGLEALTGRWDVAPATLAMALAAGFIAVHTTVLSGINVAYPQQQAWQD